MWISYAVLGTVVALMALTDLFDEHLHRHHPLEPYRDGDRTKGQYSRE